MKAILHALRMGEIIIMTDDVERENEGDLVIAAEKITPEAITFMAKYGSGLICTPMTQERLEKLKIPLMIPQAINKESHGTAFTVSVDAAHGITTGISAHDRARTIQLLVDENTTPEDLVMPGHIFPLQAHTDGLIARHGHTEASLELMIMAGMAPAAVICETMGIDGTMLRGADLKEFAYQHNLKMISIAEILAYKKSLSPCAA